MQYRKQLWFYKHISRILKNNNLYIKPLSTWCLVTYVCKCISVVQIYIKIKKKIVIATVLKRCHNNFATDYTTRYNQNIQICIYINEHT